MPNHYPHDYAKSHLKDARHECNGNEKPPQKPATVFSLNTEAPRFPHPTASDDRHGFIHFLKIPLTLFPPLAHPVGFLSNIKRWSLFHLHKIHFSVRIPPFWVGGLFISSPLCTKVGVGRGRYRPQRKGSREMFSLASNLNK